jgi:hypothetical protein
LVPEPTYSSGFPLFLRNQFKVSCGRKLLRSHWGRVEFLRLKGRTQPYFLRLLIWASCRHGKIIFFSPFTSPFTQIAPDICVTSLAVVTSKIITKFCLKDRGTVPAKR